MMAVYPNHDDELGVTPGATIPAIIVSVCIGIGAVMVVVLALIEIFKGAE